VKHYCARSAVFQQPPEAVWALITTPADYPKWRKDVKAVELLPALQGRVRWRESGGERPLTFEGATTTPVKRWTTSIGDQGLPFGGGWVFDLLPDGSGCRLTLREEGEIYNLFFRFMARFVVGYHRTLEAYLQAMAIHYGQIIRIEV